MLSWNAAAAVGDDIWWDWQHHVRACTALFGGGIAAGIQLGSIGGEHHGVDGGVLSHGLAAKLFCAQLAHKAAQGALLDFTVNHDLYCLQGSAEGVLNCSSWDSGQKSTAVLVPCAHVKLLVGRRPVCKPRPVDLIQTKHCMQASGSGYATLGALLASLTGTAVCTKRRSAYLL